MRTRQRGLSMLGFLFVAAVVVACVMVGFRVMPAYIEYYSVHKALEQALADAKDLNSAAEIRSAFQRRADAGYIESVQGRDIEITKSKNEVTASVELDPQAAAGGERQPVPRVRGNGDKLNVRGGRAAAFARVACGIDSVNGPGGCRRFRSLTAWATPFAGPSSLRSALTHRSHGATHNERLEFVGDAVLNCAVAAVLFERFPAIPEGELVPRSRESRQS